MNLRMKDSKCKCWYLKRYLQDITNLKNISRFESEIFARKI